LIGPEHRRRMMGRLFAHWRDFLLARLYRELAWSYDLVSWLVSLGRWDHWRRVALRYLGPGRVLEVGCGTGHLLLAMAREGRPLWGCDLSSPMLRQARRRMRRAGREVSLCQARVQALPFAEAAFGAVVCTFPSGYIAEGQTWAEFERVLLPGGRIVVVYGISAGGRSLRQWLLRALLALGRTRGYALRPAWAGRGRLHVRRLVVPEGEDRVALLLGEKATNAGPFAT